MHNNFQKLNTFDALTVAMIAAGLVITGVIFFTSLPQQAQVAIGKSVAILDLSEQFDQTYEQTVEHVSLVLDTSENFMNQFYVAFTQVAALPPEVVESPKLAMAKIGVIADSMARDYRTKGKVAGASIEFNTLARCDENISASEGVARSFMSSKLEPINRHATRNAEQVSAPPAVAEGFSLPKNEDLKTSATTVEPMNLPTGQAGRHATLTGWLCKLSEISSP